MLRHQPTSRRVARRSLLALGALATAGSTVLALGAPAVAATGHASNSHRSNSAHFTHAAHSSAAVAIAKQFLASTNAARVSHGVAPVGVSIRLTRMAEHHSTRMASKSVLYHNLALPREVNNWTVIGENVGVGPSEKTLQYAFMHSAPHRANILNPRYTQLGVGIVEDASGSVWVTVDFRRPEAGTYAFHMAKREIRVKERELSSK